MSEIPNNSELEVLVLGAILLEKDCLEDNMPKLHEGLFYENKHTLVFNAISQLFYSSKPVDIATVAQRLIELGNLDKVGGAPFVMSLTDNIAGTSHTEFHIMKLTELFLRRKMYEVCEQGTAVAYDESGDVFDDIANLQSKIDKLNDYVIGDDADIDISQRLEKRYQQNIKPNNGNVTGIPTGNPKLTSITRGWQNGDLIIIAARPSMGKTAYALNIMLNATLYGFKPAFFSVEMSDNPVFDRMLACLADVDMNAVYNQTLNGHEQQRYEEAKNKIIRSNIYLNDKPAKPNYIKNTLRSRKKKYGCDLAIIDYLQLLDANVPNPKNREQEVSSISRSLKQIAKELDMPIIVLSQLSRECEKRTDKRPLLSDLRESGAIEQDADLVISLYRPSYYRDFEQDGDYNKISSMTEEEYKKIVEVTILKHRNGSIGRTKEYLEPEKSKFSN